MMNVYDITGLSPEKFQERAKEAKLLLLYPWTSYRNAFLAYVVGDKTRELVYHRISEDDQTLAEWLAKMSAELQADLDGFGGKLADALATDDPFQWGQALADDLNDYSHRINKKLWFYADEVDRVPHDEKLRTFVDSLTGNINSNTQLVISSRLLKYKPWYDLIASGEAVVFGTERRANDAMFTIVDEPKPALEVYALGRGYALVNGQEITNWDGALPRNLFFYFVDNPLITRDQIFEVFWPKLTTKEATNVFHVTKRKISERITMKVNEPGSYELTQYGSGFYTPSEKVIRYYDVHEFENSIENAMVTVDEKEEAELLSRAIDLYRGPFLQETQMEWMKQRRDELRQLYSQALIGMGRLRKDANDNEGALGFFSRSLKQTPEREDIHRQVMSICLEQGRIDDAKQQYQRLTKILDEELGIGPSPESRKLYDLIQAHE